MKGKLWTWGTGAAFGREIGNYASGAFTKREQRDHAANSIVLENADAGKDFHMLVDAGAPAAEKIVRAMLRGRISGGPQVLFATHSHSDHNSDLHKLVNSRERGLKLMGEPVLPFPIIGAEKCINDERYGLRGRFAYFGERVNWLPIPEYGVWYYIRKPQGGNAERRGAERGGTGWSLQRDYDAETMLPVAFMALPVQHRSGDYGPCLYIFRLAAEEGRCHGGCEGGDCPERIVITGDFETVAEQGANPCLMNPAMLVMDTNTIRKPIISTGHTWLYANKELIRQWTTAASRTRVILTHISGFEDSIKGYTESGEEEFTHIPSDAEWESETAKVQEEIRATRARVKIEIAHDNASYSFKL